MYTIYLSNKLQKLLSPVDLQSGCDWATSFLGDWNAHLFTLDRRKCLVMINNKTYYTVFIPAILKKDLLDFSGLFLSYLLRQLTYDQVIGTGEEALIREQYGKAMLARTNNDRKTLGTMNEFIFQFKYHYAGQMMERNNLAAVNYLVNDSPTKARGPGKNKFGWPIRDMKELISQLGK
jgi:hypothetical protein